MNRIAVLFVANVTLKQILDFSQKHKITVMI